MYFNPNIRASIENLFKVLIIEIDFQKKNYLKYLFPNVFIDSFTKKDIKEFDINTFEFTSILILFHYRNYLFHGL